ARVGPVVGIVVIEQEFEAEFLGRLSQLDCVIEIVGQLARRVKQSQANPAIAVVFQNLQTRLGSPIVFEDCAVFFSLLKERNVCANRVILRARTNVRKRQDREGKTPMRQDHLRLATLAGTVSRTGSERISTFAAASPPLVAATSIF